MSSTKGHAQTDTGAGLVLIVLTGEKQGLCIEMFVVSRPQTEFFGAGTVLCLILVQEPEVVIPLGSFCQPLIRLAQCLLPFSSKTKAGQTFSQSVILHVPKIFTEKKALAPENRVNSLSTKTPPSSILTSVREYVLNSSPGL